jgi:hypothetical protein
LNLLERDAPGTKQNLYWNFLDKVRPLLRIQQEHPELRSCDHCGQPTTAEVCAFYRMTERAARRNFGLTIRSYAPAVKTA